MYIHVYTYTVQRGVPAEGNGRGVENRKSEFPTVHIINTLTTPLLKHDTHTSILYTTSRYIHVHVCIYRHTTELSICSVPEMLKCAVPKMFSMQCQKKMKPHADYLGYTQSGYTG